MNRIAALAFVFLLAMFVRGDAATYTINHALCVNATVTTNVVIKDCGGAPVLTSALAITSGKVGTLTNTLTFGGTDGSSIAFGTGGTVLYSSGIGTTLQAFDADLSAIAALSSTGIVKRTGSNTWGFAASGTDYAPATSGTSLLKGNGSGGFSNAVSATDYAPATSGSAALLGNGSGGFSAYAGATCTNQFVRSLSAAIAATCETVSLTADVTGILPIANGGNVAAQTCTVTLNSWTIVGTAPQVDCKYVTRVGEVCVYINITPVGGTTSFAATYLSSTITGGPGTPSLRWNLISSYGSGASNTTTGATGNPGASYTIYPGSTGTLTNQFGLSGCFPT